MYHHELPSLIGQSSEFLSALDQVSSLAELERPVLLIGERGTGKELLAARVHFLSKRWSEEYIAVNCAALAEHLLESELFGHEAGAFTGAGQRHIGRFERAEGGTLFLDEIANASLQVQEKILRVVEYGEFERLGGSKTLRCNVRLIGATNVDLPSQVAAGKFRADLLDRLAFDVVTLPPMRARWEDIPVLAQYFATAMARELGMDSFPGFGMSAMRLLMKHQWPGNVRELKNVVERAVYDNMRQFGASAVVEDLQLDPFASPWRPKPQNLVQASHLPTSKSDHAELPQPASGKAFMDQVRRFERVLLRQAMARQNGHKGKAAKDLSLSYDQLRHYLSKHGL